MLIIMLMLIYLAGFLFSLFVIPRLLYYTDDTYMNSGLEEVNDIDMEYTLLYCVLWPVFLPIEGCSVIFKFLRIQPIFDAYWGYVENLRLRNKWR